MVEPVFQDTVLRAGGRTQLIAQKKDGVFAGYIVRLDGSAVELANDIEKANQAYSRVRFLDSSTP
jgi:hypothetical protein